MSDADAITAAKQALDMQMSAPPYNVVSPQYIGRDWQGCCVVSSVAFGKDQKYTGLAKDGVPKGWGILEHHLGLVQICSDWEDGKANGTGTLITEGTTHYGSWEMGVRVGWFSLVKDGGIYLEEYAPDGELKRRIKWKKDRSHKRCTRCERLYVPSANTEDAPSCRYHPDDMDHNGTYGCWYVQKGRILRGGMIVFFLHVVLLQGGSQIKGAPLLFGVPNRKVLGFPSFRGQLGGSCTKP